MEEVELKTETNLYFICPSCGIKRNTIKEMIYCGSCEKEFKEKPEFVLEKNGIGFDN